MRVDVPPIRTIILTFLRLLSTFVRNRRASIDVPLVKDALLKIQGEFCMSARQ